VIGLDSVVAVLLGVVARCGNQLVQHS
jgi:hypothetical protein